MIRVIALRVLVSSVAVVGIGWLARASYTPPGSDAALLRLSWRLTPDRSEHCRRRTEEELEKLPVHMRSAAVCERDDASYRLILQIDGHRPDTTHLAGQSDGPVFVLKELPLQPGAHRVHVWFARQREDSEHEREERDEHQLRREEEPERKQRDRGDDDHAPLAIDTEIIARRGVVELITLDPASSRLIHLSAKSGSSR